MEWKFAALCGLVLVVACGDSPPLPTSTPPIPRPAPCVVLPCPLPGAHALSGVVRIDGVPVGGATVGLVKLGPQSTLSAGPEELSASQITDASGSYQFPSVENVSFSGALVSVTKADYFIDTKYILMSEARQLDFALQRAESIQVGQVVVSPAGNARCASLGYGGMGGALCRRFALPVHASGTLDVTLTSTPQQNFEVTVLRPNGTIGIYANTLGDPTFAVTVVAGGTYQVDVIATRTFQLTTAVR